MRSLFIKRSVTIRYDTETVEKLVALDGATQAKVYRAEQQRLLGIANSILKSEADSESLVEDVFCDFFFHYVHGLKHGLAIGKYLKIMTVRRAMRAKERALRHVSFGKDDFGIGAEAMTEADLDRKVFLRWLNECMALLSKKARQILKLHYGHGMSYSEIGHQLEVSKQAIGKAGLKTLMALKSCLEQRREKQREEGSF